DVTVDNKVVTPATLFGLHPDLKIEQGKRFFKDVVEPLEEAQHEHNIDISQIANLDDIELHVRRKKADLTSVLDIPEQIMLHSNKTWITIGTDHYELSFAGDDTILMVSKNQLDMWDFKTYDMRSKEIETINTFGSLSGVLNVADKYADKHFKTTFVKLK